MNSNTRYSFPFLKWEPVMKKTMNLPFERLNHFDDRPVLEHAEHLDLSLGGFLHNLVFFGRFFKLFDGHYANKY